MLTTEPLRRGSSRGRTSEAAVHHPVLQGHLLPGEESWILAPLIPQLTRRIAAGVCAALLVLLREEGTAALCSQKPSPTNIGSQLLKFLDFTVITCCVCPSKTTFDEAKVGPDSLSIRYARTGGSLPRVLLLPQHPSAWYQHYPA